MQSLGELLKNFPVHEYRPDKIWKLCAPDSKRGEEYTADVPALLIQFDINLPPNYLPETARKENLVSIIDYDTLKQIVDVAQSIRPDCSAENLVKSLNYYLEHDGFYTFDIE